MSAEGEAWALLVGDCGGTNARFAIVRPDAAGRLALSAVETLANDDFESFDDALAAYLERASIRPERAAFAVAGAIADNAATLTNRPSWRIDGAALARRFGLDDVLLVNDFAAAARGVVEAPGEAFLAVKPGMPDPEAPMVIGGPGTGFGMATVLPGNAGWRVVPGEGGHQTYAPETEDEWALAQALRGRLGHVSVEVVAAGKHAETVREALCGVLGEPYEPLTPEEVLAAAAAGDRASRAYCQLRATATMAAMGDAALLVGARGGVVLMGGVAEHLAEYLRAEAALARFTEHGPMSAYLRPIPVRLVEGAPAAMTGAALLYRDRRAGPAPTPVTPR